jgi:hypothetical protein
MDRVRRHLHAQIEHAGIGRARPGSRN